MIEIVIPYSIGILIGVLDAIGTIQRILFDQESHNLRAMTFQLIGAIVGISICGATIYFSIQELLANSVIVSVSAVLLILNYFVFRKLLKSKLSH